MKKEYITPAIYVIQMDDVCMNNASVVDQKGKTFDNFRVNEVTSGETFDNVDNWGGEWFKSKKDF